MIHGNYIIDSNKNGLDTMQSRYDERCEKLIYLRFNLLYLLGVPLFPLPSLKLQTKQNLKIKFIEKPNGLINRYFKLKLFGPVCDDFWSHRDVSFKYYFSC